LAWRGLRRAGCGRVQSRTGAPCRGVGPAPWVGVGRLGCQKTWQPPLPLRGVVVIVVVAG
jgi:hypothetical protein